MEGDNKPLPGVGAELILARKKTGNNFPNPMSPGLVWLMIVLMLVVVAVAVGVFTEDNQSGTAVISKTPPPQDGDFQARIYTISYKSGVFSPTNLRIRAGDTVKFKNDGLFAIRVASDPHPEHGDLVGFDSVGDIPPGSFFSFTFAAKGIFGYHNDKNLDETGTIIVR